MGRRFGIELEPDLFLLQKNMLMAEGIARSLDPSINIWTIGEPLIKKWMWDNRGPYAQVTAAVDEAQRFTRKLPEVLERADKTLKRIENSQDEPTLKLTTLVVSFIGISMAVAFGIFIAQIFG